MKKSLCEGTFDFNEEQAEFTREAFYPIFSFGGKERDAKGWG